MRRKDVTQINTGRTVALIRILLWIYSVAIALPEMNSIREVRDIRTLRPTLTEWIFPDSASSYMLGLLIRIISAASLTDRKSVV